MRGYADLEITLRRQSGDTCSAAFRYNSPNDDSEQRSLSEPRFTLNPAALQLKAADANDYAATLTSAFFTSEIKGEFGKCPNFDRAACGD